MKRIVLAALCASSLYAMDQNKRKLTPHHTMDPAAKQAAHKQSGEQTNQKLIEPITQELEQLKAHVMASHNSLVGNLAFLDTAQRASAINTYLCMVEKDKQIQDLHKRLAELETVVRFQATIIQRWLANEKMLEEAAQSKAATSAGSKPVTVVAKAAQNAACANPQSFQPPKLTITVSGPDDQTQIPLLK